MLTRSMTSQIAKIENEKNTKIEMLEAKIEMLQAKIELFDAKIELFETKFKMFETKPEANIDTNIQTKIPTKKAKIEIIESKNIVAKKTYISIYFIMMILIIANIFIIYKLYNERKDDINYLIKKYYAIAMDHYYY